MDARDYATIEHRVRMRSLCWQAKRRLWKTQHCQRCAKAAAAHAELDAAQKFGYVVCALGELEAS